MRHNKKKILNDPIYGFINIPDDLIYDIIEHPYFQRLRRIKQLGLTDLVYPGALHTRFHHAIGAMHLMGLALSNLRGKGHDISDDEFTAAQIAVLLHDIGHGPFSHALEHTLLYHTAHENLSTYIMSELNKEFGGGLDLALKIFTDQYDRKFFHQLVSGQLDIDRMDYLQRDSFFTGVSEGTIGADRIIKMLEIADDNLVIEEKGIYSIENFLSARRLMYWQVYLHKATVSAEKMLIKTIERAKVLAKEGRKPAASRGLSIFLERELGIQDMKQDPTLLKAYTFLDDYDVWSAIKEWTFSDDAILADLSRDLLNRKLFKVEISSEPFSSRRLKELTQAIMKKKNIGEKAVEYYLFQGSVSNAAYMPKAGRINILTKKGEILDVAQASDLPNIKAISKIVKKHYLCWPKNVYL